MKYPHKLLAAASAAFFIAGSALAQNAGTVTNHAFALGKGPGASGYTSLLCGSAQLAVGQSAADPICRTITGDVTISAAGVTAIGTTKVTSAMLNADVFSTAHTWAGQQTFVAPILGTPASGVLTNATGLPISTGVGGLGTNIATALAVNVGTAGSPVINGGVLGTPSSGTATNLTGLPVSTGISGFGTGVATFLATPSSANLRAALTDEVGTGAAYFVGGALGTPASGTATNLTGLPISTGVSGLGSNVAAALAQTLNATSGLVGYSGNLGTPSSGVATNLTGTAAGMTAGNVTTNANLTGDVTSVGNSTTLTNAPVIAKVLTGFTSGAGTVSASDSILAALQKVDGNVALRATSARNISTGCGLAGGGDLSADRTLRLNLTVNAQTGTSYTVLDGDCGKVVSFNNASAVAVTLPQANGSTFVSGWSVAFQNKGAGTVTITPTTSTVNGVASLALTQNQGVHCSSDGTNYTCVLGVGPGGGSGTVTQVVCGSGLSGGTITASGTCSLAAPVSIANGGTNDTGTAWTTYTPTISCGTGSIGTNTAVGRYKAIGKTVWFLINIAVTTNSTCGQTVLATLPFTAGSFTGRFTAAGYESAVNGKFLFGFINSTGSTVSVLNYDATFPSANGASLNISGTYESN